jgi:hypothetical protein
MAELYIAVTLSGLAATHGAPANMLDSLTLAIRTFYVSGSFSQMVTPLVVLAAHFDRIGQYEAAATIVGSAATAFALAAFRRSPAPSHIFERCWATRSMSHLFAMVRT